MYVRTIGVRTCRCAVGWELVMKERFGKPRTIEVWALSTSCFGISVLKLKKFDIPYSYKLKFKFIHS